MSTKQLVLIVGATGNTGTAIAHAILKEGNFRLAILVRQSSTSKPIVEDLVAARAELRIGDITESADKLEAALQGVDIVISTVQIFLDQRPLFDAAKKAGVSRVIPSDFGPSAPRGIMTMHDLKLDVREYIKSLGLSYTFVEVGWWLLGMIPPPHALPHTIIAAKSYVGDKDKKLIWSTLPTIGAFVERIIRDPRTVNQTVIAHDGELTQAEAWQVAEEVSGEDFSDYYKVSEKDLEAARVQNTNWIKKAASDYYYSLYIRGDNTLANAEAAGSLDGRKLYPDIPIPSVEEEMKAFYANPQVPDYGIPEEMMGDVLKPE
ncbi:hypothetical protein ONZ45_g16059 [Pleurotus djamor]|nr:hypothetical protein ONZ45_g16059 [Pleurotus djamor]